MSIQSEIERISSNVSDTLSVLSDAGVDTTGAGSNELPALVSEALNAVIPIERGGTGATTAAEAANKLGVPTLFGGTAIPANADLNNYTAVGNYYCAQTADAKTLANCPVNIAFTMRVLYANGRPAYIGQEITTMQGNRFFRYVDKASGAAVYGAWMHDYTTLTKPTAAEIGAPTVGVFNAIVARVEALEERIAALESGSASTGTFSIWYDGDEYKYTYEEGMTWDEFIDSKYNSTVECPSCGDTLNAFTVDEGNVAFNASIEGCLTGCNGWTYVLKFDEGEGSEDYVGLSSKIDGSAEYRLGNP